MDDRIKQVLTRYDQLAALILEQKVDEFADRMEQKPPDEDDVTYEQYLQRVAMEETEQQSREMENEPNELLDGMSMNDFFRQLSFEELTEILEFSAMKLDRGVPDSVIHALAASDDRSRVIEYAARMIGDAAWVDEELSDENMLFEMEFQKLRACLKVLIASEDGSLVRAVIDRFMSYPRTTEFVADSIAEYVEAFPEESVPYITEILDSRKEEGLEGPCEDLLIMITNIGKKKQSDEIYSVLRQAFRYMNNKIYAVICLADYNDGRAVPMLKSYINRHQKTISRELFYEMMSAIQNLGGDIADISDPFGDFQKKMNKNEK